MFHREIIVNRGETSLKSHLFLTSFEGNITLLFRTTILQFATPPFVYFCFTLYVLFAYSNDSSWLSDMRLMQNLLWMHEINKAFMKVLLYWKYWQYDTSIFRSMVFIIFWNQINILGLNVCSAGGGGILGSLEIILVKCQRYHFKSS